MRWISWQRRSLWTVGKDRNCRATASKIPVILAVLDVNLVCSYNVYCRYSFNNHPNYGCKSLEYSQNFRSITVSGLPYLMKNPYFDAVALIEIANGNRNSFSTGRDDSRDSAIAFVPGSGKSALPAAAGSVSANHEKCQNESMVQLRVTAIPEVAIHWSSGFSRFRYRLDAGFRERDQRVPEATRWSQVHVDYPPGKRRC